MKKKTNAWYKKEADRLFSIYIRQKYPSICYTCGKKVHWKQLQNGHYITRSVLTTRYLEDNCRPQCVGCNIWGNGKKHIFADNLLKELGDKRFKELLRLGRVSMSFKVKWIKEIIEKYNE